MKARVEMSVLRGWRVASRSLQFRTAPVSPSTTRVLSSIRWPRTIRCSARGGRASSWSGRCSARVGSGASGSVWKRTPSLGQARLRQEAAGRGVRERGREVDVLEADDVAAAELLVQKARREVHGQAGRRARTRHQRQGADQGSDLPERRHLAARALLEHRQQLARRLLHGRGTEAAGVRRELAAHLRQFVRRGREADQGGERGGQRDAVHQVRAGVEERRGRDLARDSVEQDRLPLPAVQIRQAAYHQLVAQLLAEPVARVGRRVRHRPQAFAAQLLEGEQVAVGGQSGAAEPAAGRHMRDVRPQFVLGQSDRRYGGIGRAHGSPVCFVRSPLAGHGTANPSGLRSSPTAGNTTRHH